MQSPEDILIEILKANSIDFVSSLPCDRIKFLLERVKKEFFHIPMTREEEGVGISRRRHFCGYLTCRKEACNVCPELRHR
jgi:sulfopyruvate decarboxylase TPP-binding subunit